MNTTGSIKLFQDIDHLLRVAIPFVDTGQRKLGDGLGVARHDQYILQILHRIGHVAQAVLAERQVILSQGGR